MKVSLGNVESLGENTFSGVACRGEKKESLGVGGTSTKRMPVNSANELWTGLFVIVSARGDSNGSSSGIA